RSEDPGGDAPIRARSCCAVRRARYSCDGGGAGRPRTGDSRRVDMELKPALPQDVLSVGLGQIGVSKDIDPISVETLPCLLRHGASVMCPTSRQSLVTAATEAFQPLVSADDLRGRCRAVLDELIAHGDLVEFEHISHAVN